MEFRRRGTETRVKSAKTSTDLSAKASADLSAGESKENQPEKEAKKSETKEEQQVKGRFVTKVVNLPGDILVLYWLAKAAFPEYHATEGEWIADCVRQFYAEHSDELYNLEDCLRRGFLLYSFRQ
ncbi:hypothetical protein ACFLTV_01040 [Chloroflexota bacterium]